MSASKIDKETAAGLEFRRQRLTRRHEKFGWWALLLFLSLGVALETMHAIKLDWFLNVANETHRLMLRLAHAHGVLLAVVNLCYAATLRHTAGPAGHARSSPLLIAGSLLIPCGFLFGGLKTYGGDPNPFVLLVPVGAVALFAAVFLIARSVGKG